MHVVADRTYCYRLVDDADAHRRSTDSCVLAEGLAFTAGPSPNSGRIEVAFSPRSLGPVALAVVDVSGRVVHLEGFPLAAQGAQRRVVEMPTVHAGVYFVQLRQGSRTESARIVVVR